MVVGWCKATTGHLQLCPWFPAPPVLSASGPGDYRFSSSLARNIKMFTLLSPLRICWYKLCIFILIDSKVLWKAYRSLVAGSRLCADWFPGHRGGAKPSITQGNKLPFLLATKLRGRLQVRVQFGSRSRSSSSSFWGVLWVSAVASRRLGCYMVSSN